MGRPNVRKHCHHLCRAIPLLVAAAALTVAGCAQSSGGRATTPSAAATVQPREPSGSDSGSPDTTRSATHGAISTVVSLYFVDGRHLVASHRSVTGTAVATAAVRELLNGPTAQERALGMSSLVPPGAQLRGITIAGGTATVDLSSGFASDPDPRGGPVRMRLAQVAFTATQFGTVQRVQFRLAGTPWIGPVTRASYEDLLPAILPESPTAGEHVRSPIGVRGSANVFEGVLQVDLSTTGGTVLTTRTVQATSGTGTRGQFSVNLGFSVHQATPATLAFFVNSAKDGSRVDIVQVPLTLDP